MGASGCWVCAFHAAPVRQTRTPPLPVRLLRAPASRPLRSAPARQHPRLLLSTTNAATPLSRAYSSSELIPIGSKLARKILARYTCDSQEIRLGGDIDMPQSAANRWVLLIHQIPPKPDYFRVKVGRRLQRLGAVAIKNSVYVLPRSDETVEDFQWQSREIVADLSRLKRRLVDVVAIDFFGAPRRRAAQEEVVRLEARLRPRETQDPPPAHPARAPRGATWVTREGVYIDRIASAWLISRFIDPKARFKLVAAEGYRPRPGELRFDMFEAEYTHEGDACTFETLVARFGLGDRALRVIAEIAHDIDCKEAKFGRPEAPGVERLIAVREPRGVLRVLLRDAG